MATQERREPSDDNVILYAGPHYASDIEPDPRRYAFAPRG